MVIEHKYILLKYKIQQIVISETLMTLTSVDVLGNILIHSFHGDLLSSIELNQNIDLI